MRNNVINKVVILILLLSVSGVFSAMNTSDNAKRVRENVKTYFTGSDFLDEEKANELLNSMKADGSWPGLDYKNKQRSEWPLMKHLEYMRIIASAYSSEKSSMYKNDEVAQKYLASLRFWLKSNPGSNNWWYGKIGIPRDISPSVIMMYDLLSDSDKSYLKPVLDKSVIGMSGQNKVWLAGNVLFRGAIYDNDAEIEEGSKIIKNELVMRLRGEGIQADWSYHQHGSQLQFGNYGLHFIEDMVKWIYVLYGTPFAFEGDRVETLRNYMLEGQQWVVWKNAMDISSCGRQLFIDSPKKKCANLFERTKELQNIDIEHNNEYDDMFDYTKTIGFKHFWCSDYSVKRTKDYFFSVKMCSSRVLGAESCNGENLQGYHMGDGVALLYQTGKEYENIFPYWNWKKVPGLTVVQDSKPLPVLTAWGYKIESDFAGGVTDGTNGITAMTYTRDGVNAEKSWFVFGDEIVCVGDNIKSDLNDNITTSVNQMRGFGKVYTNNGEFGTNICEQHNDVQWVWHDNVGYVFPEKSDLYISDRIHDGSWSTVANVYPDKKESARIFSLWLEHGVKPDNATYSYIMLPDISKKEISKYKASKYIISHGKDVHSVVTKDKAIGGAVFRRPAEAKIMEGIYASAPCILMYVYDKNEKKYKFYLSEPTRKLKEITIKFKGKYDFEGSTFVDGHTVMKINLPKGGKAGSTLEF